MGATVEDEGGNQDAVRAQFLELGFEERLLSRAISAYKTPAQAQHWIDVFGPHARRSENIYEISISNLTPDQYVLWSQAGLDGLRGMRLARRLTAAGLGPDDYLKWTALGLSSLNDVLRYLNSDFGFDEALRILTSWSSSREEAAPDAAGELVGLLKSGLDIDQLRLLIDEGISGHQVHAWYGSRIPAAEWPDWISHGIDRKAAEVYRSKSVRASVAYEWQEAGVNPSAAIVFTDRDVQPRIVREWLDAGVLDSEAAEFVKLNIPLETVREWRASGVPASDALAFIAGGFSLDSACNALAADLAAVDAVEYIGRGASLAQAVDFDRRGIGPHQLIPADDGFTLDLDPWQVDPLEELPDVIEPGRVKFTVWSSLVGGDHPTAYDVFFDWDGEKTAEWHEDISIINGLSFASSSPTHGVISWPNERDALLTYSWSELGLHGYDQLPGMAPSHSDDGASAGAASDPRQWLRLAEALVEFVLTDLGSGGRDDDGWSEEYVDTRTNALVDIHTVFRDYLEESQTTYSFKDWLVQAIQGGTYVSEDSE